MLKRRVIVISLGGSLIIPDKVNYSFLEKLKQTLRKYYPRYKFVIVCGGGAIARAYISALEKEHSNSYQKAQAGIRATRMNALFLMQFFGREANDVLPRDMKEIKSLLKKNNIVFCGALRWVLKSTSDTTAARLAQFLKSDFINLTNVQGLYTSNPLTHKNARFIARISWRDFEKKAHALSFHAGQHYVLDQQASTLIRKHKIKTYIIGDKMNNLSFLLRGKPFKGTIISE